MRNMFFKGDLKDYLDSQKLYIDQLIRFGVDDASAIYNDFHIAMPVVDFENPIDIARLDSDNRYESYYILKFNITGNTEILNYRPSTKFVEMPEWLIKGSEIWFKIEEKNLEATKITIQGVIETFKSHLLDINVDIQLYEANLMTDIVKLINVYQSNMNAKDAQVEEVKNYLLFGE